MSIWIWFSDSWSSSARAFSWIWISRINLRSFENFLELQKEIINELNQQLQPYELTFRIIYLLKIHLNFSSY
ncbi:hypothetical protein [Mycoplasmopsis cricetuli]|uniref:hypothetical protein n=1 Tax=Mycoplasmopsis cricetuli TaxID=171283 RepID=UPI0012EC2ACF|nr:hypothetical protein [Mycoplasmopsis cricetuli]